MPKIVDHDLRREELAEAAWRAIRKEGLGAVSVRKIASEAGVSLGSLRHYFNNQSGLLNFSMSLVSRRVHQRISGKGYRGESFEEILKMVAELMPVDEERRAEGEVWLAFLGQAVSDRSTREFRYQIHQKIFAYFQTIILCLAKCCILKESIDYKLEARRLHALVDGLVVHHLTYPDMMTSDEMSAIVKHHLSQLIMQ